MAADAEGDGEMRKTFILAMLLCAPLSAQTTFPLSLSLGDFGEYGYESPYSDIGAGIEWRSRRVMADTSLAYSPTAKLDAGDGYSLSGRGVLLLRYRSLIFGGGISQTRVVTEKWQKTATRSHVTAGIDTDRWRIAITRNTPGADSNALTGWSASARVNLSSRIRVGGEIFSSSFDDQAGQGRQAQGTLVRIEYILGR